MAQSTKHHIKITLNYPAEKELMLGNRIGLEWLEFLKNLFNGEYVTEKTIVINTNNSAFLSDKFDDLLYYGSHEFLCLCG